MRTTVCKTFKFSASHFLEDDPGMCQRLHGHTYTGEVEVGGEPDASGIVVHFDDLKASLASLLEAVDHRHLGPTLRTLEGNTSGEPDRERVIPAALPIDYQPPTVENITRFCFDRLRLSLEASSPRAEVRRVTVFEGPGASATVTP